MGTTHADVVAAIRSSGFARLDGRFTEPAFRAFAAELGEICADTPVRVVPGKRTYLTSPGAIPLHTDHPRARLIAWRCDAQDETDGATLLADGREVVRSLDAATRRVLAATHLPAMVRLGDEALSTPVLGGPDPDAPLFFAPWLEPIERTHEARDALARLRSSLASTRARPVRLAAGEVLVVDNHRILHGRGPIGPTSARSLRRLWIAARA